MITKTDQSQLYGALNRQPKNVNPLYPNKFIFFLTKLPELSLSSNSCNIPSMNGSNWKQVTSVNPIPRSGLNIEFEELEVTFIVDADMNNWSELANWMLLMYMVKTSADYETVKLEQLQPHEEGGLTSDAQLILLTNQSVPNIVFYFRDAFPIYLSGFHLTNDVNEPIAIEATVRFAYSYYDFESVTPTQPDTTDDSTT